jgi:hypothetical protein
VTGTGTPVTQPLQGLMTGHNQLIQNVHKKFPENWITANSALSALPRSFFFVAAQERREKRSRA